MKDNCLAVFDKIYLINLEKRKDRLNQWFADNKNIVEGLTNFEVIKGIDGSKLEKNELWGKVMGSLGCLETHLMILKDVKEKGYKKVLIFEDDFKFIKNFEKVFKKGWSSLPNDWDMLYLYAGDYTPAEPYNDYLLKCTASLSTVAYAITNVTVPLFIELLERKAHAVDIVYGHLHFLINAFRFKQNICQHYDGFSDVINDYSKYHLKPTFKQRLISKIKHFKDRLS